jgi:hypothetical protein
MTPTAPDSSTTTRHCIRPPIPLIWPVQHTPSSGTPQVLDGLAAHLPGVSIDRRDTDESSNTTAIELAEFGQIGDQRVCGDIANARK